MTLSDISNILRIDIEAYFNDSINFINRYDQVLIEYFTNETSYPKSAFDSLDNLLSRSVEIYQIIPIVRGSLSDHFCFEVFDSFEDTYASLQTIDNYSRWLRSSFLNGRFKESVEIDFILRQNQTLESMSDELGFLDREEGFLDLSLRNHIREIDYSLNGGLLFQFNYQNDQSIQLTTVIDNLVGNNVLGKDIQRKIEITDDDIIVLSPEDTFFQTCEILTGLLKGNNPEFPNQGFNKATLSNKNILGTMLPTFIRQLYATVGRDDTIDSFQILSVNTDQDALRIEVEYRSHISTEVRQVVYGN